MKFSAKTFESKVSAFNRSTENNDQKLRIPKQISQILPVSLRALIVCILFIAGSKICPFNRKIFSHWTFKDFFSSSFCAIFFLLFTFPLFAFWPESEWVRCKHRATLMFYQSLDLQQTHPKDWILFSIFYLQ